MLLHLNSAIARDAFCDGAAKLELIDSCTVRSPALSLSRATFCRPCGHPVTNSCVSSCGCISVVGSDQSEDEDSNEASATVTGHSVRWTDFQPSSWTKLLDQHCHEM